MSFFPKLRNHHVCCLCIEYATHDILGSWVIPALNYYSLHASMGSTERGGQASRTASNDDYIKVFHVCPSLICHAVLKAFFKLCRQQVLFEKDLLQYRN